MEPIKYRVWTTTLANWQEIARELKRGYRHDDLVRRVSNFESNDPNARIGVVVELDDCASLRELIADLGLTGDMEDATEDVEEEGILSMAVELARQAEAWERIKNDLWMADEAGKSAITRQAASARRAIPNGLRGLVL